jgi:2-octaprenyl-6-methoxyphenol hydroxylase
MILTLVGGGPVGSALACALAHHGIPVRVVDCVPLAALLSDRTSDNRAIALSPTAKNLLETIGVWKNIQADAEPILEIKTVHGSTGSTVSFKKDNSLGHIVPMSVLKQGIAQRVKDFSPLIQWVTGEVTDIQKNTYSLSVLLKDGTALETPALIGADGKNSKVRQLGGFESMAWDYGKEAIVCTYKHDGDHQGIAWEIFMEEGPFAILPMTENRFSIVWSVQEDIAHALKELSDEDFDAVMRGKIEGYRTNIERISPRWIYPIGIQLTERYAKDGIVLVGDAAHVMHPLAGQGVNMGFRDVAALAEILVEYHALGLFLGDPQAHAKYERQRRFDNLSMTMMTDGFDALFSNHSKILEKLRESGLQWVERSTGLKSLFVENAVGV